MAGALAKAKGVRAFFAKYGKVIWRFLTAPLRMTLPGRAAWCFAVCMVLILIGMWVVYASSARHVPWTAYMSWPRGILIAASIALASALVYWTTRLWLSEEPVNLHLRRTWRKGLKDLQQQGLPIEGLPIHLLIGEHDANAGLRLMETAGEHRVLQSPGLNDPFAWAANGDRICLTAHAVGLTSLAAQRLHAKSGPRGTCGDVAVLDIVRASGSAANSGDDLLAVLQRAGVEPQATANPSGSPAVGFGTEAANNTEAAGGNVATLAPPQRRPHAIPLALVETACAADDRPLWSLTEAATATEDLRQLASLLRSERRPLCPLNRIVIALPFPLLSRSPEHALVLQRAIRRDLETLQDRLQVNAPVCVLITGMDEHQGFLELVRRIGPEAAARTLLGQAVEIGSPTNRTQLAALAELTCGKLEDTVYALLRESSALSNPGNALLYRLLCDVRTGFRTALTLILTGGLAHDAVTDTALARQHVAGCYFVASGSQPHQRGFVGPVFASQDNAQDELDWLPSALARETRHRWLGRAGWLVAGLSAVGLIAQAAWSIWLA